MPPSSIARPSTPPPAKSFLFLCLPNETLRQILSYLFLPSVLQHESTASNSFFPILQEKSNPFNPAFRGVQYDFRGKDAAFLDTLCSVRSVSTRLRQVVNELPFWSDRDFNPLDLALSRSFKSLWPTSNSRVESRDYRDESFITTFFIDKTLGILLGQRAYWNFRSLKALVAVMWNGFTAQDGTTGQ